MKARFLPVFCSLMLLGAMVCGAETFDAAMKGAAADYNERLAKAGAELNATRARLAEEKAPLLERMRAAENRIIAAEGEIRRLETNQETAAEDRRKLLKLLDDSRRTTSYLTTLAHESLKTGRDGLAPGEEQLLGERMQALEQQLGAASGIPTAQMAVGVAEFLFQRTRQTLGGYLADGDALLSGSNQVIHGQYAFMGPETYFLAKEGGGAATVRSRAGATHPIAYVLKDWKPAEAAALFDGRSGTVVADASGGKALRLKETKGTVWEHIQKGGMVAYVIVIVGVVALLMILQKMDDVRRMALDSPAAVQGFLDVVARGASGEAERAAESLQGASRELFAVGLRHRHDAKPILEEHLQAVLLGQRMHFERGLPLLAVIATAAPLMGLLGTVVGMVKTFALITVFGTGNAGKLSSGISEVLVATELGLVVAIPTLVAHGFLAHRIQKNLSLLERYALQFVTAVETANVRQGENAAIVGVSA